jgi:hypothetical protein
MSVRPSAAKPVLLKKSLYGETNELAAVRSSPTGWPFLLNSNTEIKPPNLDKTPNMNAP